METAKEIEKDSDRNKKLCPVCKRYYERDSCEYCKRTSLWNRQVDLQVFTPRIKKILNENLVKIDPKDINYLHDGGSLLITGKLGVGKTIYGAAVMLESMRLCYIEDLKLGYHHFVKISGLLQKIRDSFDGDGDKISLDFLYRDFILFDDLGTEKVTDWVIDTLYRIVDYRYEYMLPTIFTTNLTGEELSDKIGNRITDRIEEMCRVVVLENKNYRNGR